MVIPAPSAQGKPNRPILPLGLFEDKFRKGDIGEVSFDRHYRRPVTGERFPDFAGCARLDSPGHSLVIRSPVGKRNIPAGHCQLNRDTCTDASGAPYSRKKRYGSAGPARLRQP
jgi:hypothetical protein